jgi:hypothetical protein
MCALLNYLRSNHTELKAWRDEKASRLSIDKFLESDELLSDIYHESLSLMYRLLFLFYAESRDLLPMDNELYRDTYSLESIRDDITSVHDDPDPKRFFGKGSTDLWGRLKELFAFVQKGWRNIIPAYNGGLFDPELHPFLERFKVGDYHVARAIDLLSRTQPRSRQGNGEGRKKVTYRDLDVRHLGSIYEGLLEYSAHIATQDLVVIKRGSGDRSYEEYVPASELKPDERQQLTVWQAAVDDNQDNPGVPRGCRVMGRKESGRYFLVYGGKESKRKSSGSYYTPDYIVQYIVEDTLGYLVRGENRDADKKNVPLTSDEILQLKVLDPAMGSGHFLVAATEYLALAYAAARIRESKDRSSVMGDEDFIRYKRVVAERCIYGVDANPMAVELAKLSIWLFTMDRGRPLSFLNHHLKCGNALLGAWVENLGRLPAQNGSSAKSGQNGQGNLFEQQFKSRLPVMIKDLFGIMQQETLTYADIQAKNALDNAVEQLKRPFTNIADLWVATLFGEQIRDYDALLSRITSATDRISPAAKLRRFFHWELAFPEVFFDQQGAWRADPGFSACIGNPPYVRVELLDNDEKRFLKQSFRTIVDRCDVYVGFIEQGLHLLAKQGLMELIVSGQFTKADYGSNLRSVLQEPQHIRLLIDLEPLQVFRGATTYPIILGCSKSPADTLQGAWAGDVCAKGQVEDEETVFGRLVNTPRKTVLGNLAISPWAWARTQPSGLSIAQRSVSCRIGQICNVSSGVTSGKDEILTLPIVGAAKGYYKVLMEGREALVARELWRPILRPRQLGGWTVDAPREVVFFPYIVNETEFVLISESRLRETCHSTYQYLREHRTSLEERRDSRKTWKEHGRPWYSLHRVGKPIDHKPPRLLSPGEFAINRFGLSQGREVWPHARIIGISCPIVPVRALQLYLNSEEVWSHMRANFPAKRGGYRGMAVGDLAEVPCPAPESAVWNELVSLASAQPAEAISSEIESKVRSQTASVLTAAWI